MKERLELSAGAAGRLWREMAACKGAGEVGMSSENGKISSSVETQTREWGEGGHPVGRERVVTGKSTGEFLKCGFLGLRDDNVFTL